MSCMMPPSCSFCKHYLGDAFEDREGRAVREIPDDIITGSNDHTAHYPGDNNILFLLDEALKDDFEEVKEIREELSLYVDERNFSC